MENFLAKHSMLVTFSTMLFIAIFGHLSLRFIQGYGALNVLIIMWLTPTVIGGFLCLSSGICLFFSQAKRKVWKKAMLVGLWFLLVSGGSCGFLWMSVALMLQ